MSRLAIKVEHLSKAYQLGQIGTGTISRDIERWWTTKILRKEDPFLQIGQTNDRTIKGDSDIVWSLRDLNFEIEKGSAVGVIGKNGAGKSTLLKLLSRVTAPTDGRIKIKGRIASLLEVGTGFHPELTGRENIFLNGAILGMRKHEIIKRFDEIVAFSGVERYVDTPVKRYSSGMYVRLAFAVAAHLESEILIVDEVLAVGDAEFQRKCLGKMGEVSKGDGRTVLFVSHNMDSIQSFCKQSILLDKGTCSMFDTTETVIARYMQSMVSLENTLTQTSLEHERGSVAVKIIEPIITRGELIQLEINLLNFHFIPGEEIGLFLFDEVGRKLGFYTLEIQHRSKIVFQLESNYLLSGIYQVKLFGHLRNQTGTFEMPTDISFEILATNSEEKVDNEYKRLHGSIFLPITTHISHV